MRKQKETYAEHCSNRLQSFFAVTSSWWSTAWNFVAEQLAALAAVTAERKKALDFAPKDFLNLISYLFAFRIYKIPRLDHFHARLFVQFYLNLVFLLSEYSDSKSISRLTNSGPTAGSRRHWKASTSFAT